MLEEVKTAMQQAFAEIYDITELARLYYEIRFECEKQHAYRAVKIAKEMEEDG